MPAAQALSVLSQRVALAQHSPALAALSEFLLWPCPACNQVRLGLGAVRVTQTGLLLQAPPLHPALKLPILSSDHSAPGQWGSRCMHQCHTVRAEGEHWAPHRSACLWRSAACIPLHPASPCTLHPLAPCIPLHPASPCTLQPLAPCIPLALYCLHPLAPWPPHRSVPKSPPAT
jgi:hypothetical protein